MKTTSIFKILLITALYFFITQAFSTTIYLQAKKYLDVKTGHVVEPANLLIEEGKITAINPQSIPSFAKLIKKPNLILLPGLIDVHVHLLNDFNKQFALQFVQEDDALVTLRGVKNAYTLLLAGFTTVRNLGLNHGESFVDVGLAKASEAHWIKAPHIIPCGHPISMTGGHIDSDMIGGYAPNVLKMDYKKGVADGVDEVTKAVRYQLKYGAKVIKVAATAGVLSKEEGVGNQQYSIEELKAIADEAHRHGILVAAHAHGTDGINAAIKAGIDSIEHGSLLNDESIRLMKQRGTFLVPTNYLVERINLADLDETSRKKHILISSYKKPLQQAIKAKVNIAFGTDSGVFPHGENAKQFASLVASGMSPLDSIRTATLNAAQLLKLQDRGQIATGFHADIIGVLENPLDNIRTLESPSFVMKDGEIIKG